MGLNYAMEGNINVHFALVLGAVDPDVHINKVS
jgi:hypothetical protein